MVCMFPFQVILGWPTQLAGALGRIAAAIYIRSKDLVSVIIAHSAIDITSRIFAGGQTTSGFALILFGAMLLVEVLYAFYLMRETKDKSE